MYLIRKMTEFKPPRHGKGVWTGSLHGLALGAKDRKNPLRQQNPLNETIRDIMANINSKL